MRIHAKEGIRQVANKLALKILSENFKREWANTSEIDLTEYPIEAVRAFLKFFKEKEIKLFYYNTTA